MITYSQLGKNGRLGNQMFQYATLLSVGLTRGYQVAIPSNQQLSKVFKLKNAEYIEDFDNKLVYKEKDFTFDGSIFLVPDNVDLHGYFQSGYYFGSCEDFVRKEFEFQDEIKQKASQFLEKYAGIPLCSVHVRRGDYKRLSNYHTNLDKEYYIPACSLVYENVPNVKFLVFSDEPDWCRESFKDDKFVIVDTKDDALDLCIMSQCPVHIIANSSFSWWGAWLSRSTAVVAPKQWFGPAGPKTWDSVYQKGWVLV